ncbi:uncharacterized protein [Dysidea avara]|uniref:uncharacterized protein n=1 Tax=Dysidea avara TaxID=196820 RepID=UPI003322647C
MAADKPRDKLLEDTAKQFTIQTLNLTERELGRGSYGAVRVAVYRGKECVVKEIFPHIQQSHVQKSRKAQDAFLGEINTLSTLRHPCIVQFLGVHYQDGAPLPLLVMEKMHQSLHNFVEKTPDCPPHVIASILRDIACGLTYLHAKNVIHRDLKADNILLTSSNDAKIGDLGVAKVMASFNEGQHMTKEPGNTAHMPPEAQVDKAKYTTKLDIFSFGCVTIYSVVKQVPIPTDKFRRLESQEAYERVDEITRRKKYLDKMDHVLCLHDLAKECLSDEPKHRPEPTELVERLTQAMEELKEGDDLESPSKDSLVKENAALQQQVDEHFNWKRICFLLVIAFFILYFIHWVSICNEAANASPRLQQACTPILNIEQTVETMLGSAKDTLYSLTKGNFF